MTQKYALLVLTIVEYEELSLYFETMVHLLIQRHLIAGFFMFRIVTKNSILFSSSFEVIIYHAARLQAEGLPYPCIIERK